MARSEDEIERIKKMLMSIVEDPKEEKVAKKDMSMVPERLPDEWENSMRGHLADQEDWEEWRRHAENGDSGYWGPDRLAAEYKKYYPKAYEQFLKDKEKKHMDMVGLGQLITGDEILFNTDPKDSTWHLPQGLTYERAASILDLKRREQEKIVQFNRTYDYRPPDGAVAAAKAIKDLFGISIGATIPGGMFSPEQPPAEITVNLGSGRTVTVPWGKVIIPSLQGAEFYFEAERGKDGLPVFSVKVESPKKHKPQVDKLLNQIQKNLETSSIYRGHILVGAGELEFLDFSTFDPKKIVFSDFVEESLEAALYGTIKNSKVLKADGLPLKRSILLYGAFGTGKSSIGQITAKVAEANGWTFLQARTGVDSVEDVLNTAKLYQPAVVFVEDIGEQASALNDSSKVSSLLETFDGITSKNSEIIMVLTTNHVENIHKGMLRPGRIDLALEIGPLDRNGTERLIRVVVDPKKLAEDVDFDLLYKGMEGWEPAWVKAVADRAKLWAINRNGGRATYVLNTADLVNAAESLHSQLELLRKASEGVTKPVLHEALQEVFEGSLHGVAIVDEYGDPDERMWLSTADRATRKDLK